MDWQLTRGLATGHCPSLPIMLRGGLVGHLPPCWPRPRIWSRAYCVTRACGPTVRATVYPAVLAPLPAYGTRLRCNGPYCTTSFAALFGLCSAPDDHR